MKRYFSFLFLLFITALGANAQDVVTGCVMDLATREPLPFANVFYSKGGGGVQTDLEGKFKIRHKDGRITISMLGYEAETIRPRAGKDYDVYLRRTDNSLKEAIVEGRRKRYRRKDNPAVIMMRKVIAAKDSSDLKRHDFYSVDKYRRLTMAFNDVTDKTLDEDFFKRMPFLRNQVQYSPEVGKLILPISVDETVSRTIYRKSPEAEKEIVEGEKTIGFTELFQTGELFKSVAEECFADVDIYKDEVMLMQYPFISPIAGNQAIGFYRYFIEDTVLVDKDSCFHLSFTPNNQQDFGFSGSLYIMADSSWRVKKVDLGVPPRNTINWLDRMRVVQTFERLPSGEQVMVHDNMVVELKVLEFLPKAMVRRTTSYRDFSFAPLPDAEFDFKGNKLVLEGAEKRDEAFWHEHRGDSLMHTEKSLQDFMDKLMAMRWFKPVMFFVKALAENNVETSLNPDKPSKIDIGPINTMVTSNFVEGLRLRGSFLTTRDLHPRWFLKGYGAYGFKDHRWKGSGTLTYCFEDREFAPHEFPMHNLSFSYSNDVMSPSDKFLPTDKDNVFVSMKWTTVNHMMYYETWKLNYEKEWMNGLRLTAQLRTEKDSPTAALFYQPLSAGVNGLPTQDVSTYRKNIRTTDASLSLIYRPNAAWINTKQRRAVSNHHAPRLTLSHTIGQKGVLGSDYSYNFTEATAYKRIWIPRMWGRLDIFLKGGVQWNKVPYPLLIMPAANLSYIIEDEMFWLIDNMEFLNDRYASLMLEWDMNGKILNRIPLLKRLKWREMIGCNVLWGTLTDKNNPFLARNAGSDELFFFPGEFGADGFVSNTRLMDSHKPYVEVFAGVHNIFNLLQVQYVRRLTYTDFPGVSKWGIRVALRVSF